MDKNPITIDHTGRTFDTQKDMLSFWGVTTDVFWRRRKKGLSLEECLTTKGRKQPAYDHLGNEYASRTAMAAHYGINVRTLNNRLKSKWPLEKALTEPTVDQSVPVTDHLGNEYPSAKAMADTYGVTASHLRRNLFDRNLDPAQALFGVRHVRDHEGTLFKSEFAMCKHYGVSQPLYKKRIAEGMSQKDALTTPAPQISIPCKDHLGNEYESMNKMCQAYGIDPMLYKSRLKNGWTVEKALTEPHASKRPCTDWTGTTHGSITDMARALHVEHHDLKCKDDADMPDVSARACAKRWPGTDAANYRIRECVAFPWFLCEDMSERSDAPHAGELVLRADRILELKNTA